MKIYITYIENNTLNKKYINIIEFISMRNNPNINIQKCEVVDENGRHLTSFDLDSLNELIDNSLNF